MSVINQLLVAYASGGPVEPIDPNLIAWYRLENNPDDSAGVNHGTNGASSAYAAAKVDLGLSFTGAANERIELPNINAGSAWTMEMWFYYTFPATNATGCGLFGDTTAAGSNLGGLLASRTSIGVGGLQLMSFFQNNTQRLTTVTGRILRNTWYKVSITYDGSVHKLFLNEREVLGCTVSSYSQSFNHATTVGQIGGTNTWFGLLDEVKIYNVAKTYSPGSQILQYNCDSRADALGWWDVQDNSSPQYGDGYDSSSNGAWAFSSSATHRRHMSSISPGAQWTVEADIFPATGTTNGGFVFIGATGTASWRGLSYLTDGRFRVHHNNSVVVTPGAGTSPINSWSRIKVTYDNNKLRLYESGTLIGTEAGTHATSWASGQLVLGHTQFTGRIDNVKIYDAVV